MSTYLAAAGERHEAVFLNGLRSRARFPGRRGSASERVRLTLQSTHRRPQQLGVARANLLAATPKRHGPDRASNTSFKRTPVVG